MAGQFGVVRVPTLDTGGLGTANRNSVEVLNKEYGRNTHILPNVFLNFMDLFRKIHGEKLVCLKTSRERYVNGLAKLAAAEKQVSSMQHDLAVLQPQLEAAMGEARVMLDNVEKERIAVDKASYHVKQDEKIANIQAEAAIALKTECENDLALAIPILEDAIEALNTLKPTDITLVKSMKNPPDTVKLVMAAVCVMKDVKPDRVPDPTNPGRKIMDFWGPSKRILGDMAFLQTLKDYDKDNIPPHIMQTIRKVYIPNKDFRPHVVAKASSAAEGLCKWVLAMDKYDTVVKMVAPKKKKLATAEEEYGRTVGLLEEKRAELILLQDKLKDLNTTLSAAVNQKQKFQKEVDICAQKLKKAEAIMESLFSEKERWTGQVESLAQSLEAITGDVLISTAGLAYLGPFPKPLREQSLNEWISLLKGADIPVGDGFDLTKILMDPTEVESWILSGLPNDATSIESGFMLFHVQKWPLCIDPHRQANQWMKAKVLQDKGYVTRSSDENCLSLLQDAMESGAHLLVEDMSDHNDSHPSCFLSLLSHTFDINDGLTINGKFVRFHPDFRIFMTTVVDNPYYLPQAYNKIVVIDFTLSELGLAEQLVTTMVEIERKEISMDRNSFMQIRSSNKKILKDAEDAILELLSTESNIVADHASVEKLRVCKETSKRAQLSELDSEKLQNEIDRARELYIPLANYSATLFSTIKQLEKIDTFYQYSVSWFIGKFMKSIQLTKHDEIDLALRISNLKNDFTMSLHKSIIASVQNNHKLLVSFFIWAAVFRFDGLVTDSDWKTFRQSIVELRTEKHKRPEDVLNRLVHLENHEAFEGLREEFDFNVANWDTIFATEEIGYSDIPTPFGDKLSDFQKTILLINLRPDKVVKMMRVFLFETAGKMCELEYQLTSIYDVFKESDRHTPIVFSLVGGGDAVPFILELHEKLGFTERLRILTLGKDQESEVNLILREALKGGSWICLQNCEVASDGWFADLSSFLQANQSNTANLNFRVFMTFSSENRMIPLSLLRNSLKISVEVTDNLKSSLWENYHTGLVGSNEFYNCCGKKQNVFAKLLFGISFFHGVAKEREKFGSRGWNHPYYFDECDYSISIKNLQYIVQTSNVPPIDSISYIIGNITHGGKITNKWDQRVLNTLISKYVNHELLGAMGYCLCGMDEKYVIPIGYSQMDYITFINGLPDFTSPEVLGFQTSSSIVLDIEEGAQFLKAAKQILEKTQNWHPFDEKHVLGIIESLLEKIAPAYELSENQDGRQDYLGAFHRKESKCYGTQLCTIRSVLENLQHSCKGMNVVNADQELIIDHLINNRLPPSWIKVSYSSVKSLSAYMQDLLKRLQNHAEWEGVRNTRKHWLSGFFTPRTFLMAKINDFSRTQDADFSSWKLNYSVTPFKQVRPDRNFQIYGLYTDSCRWNPETNRIEDQIDAIQHEELPAINVEIVDVGDFSLNMRYVCPVYQTVQRDRIESKSRDTGFIAEVYLDCEQPDEQWILKGAALLSQVE